ncbi:MAG: hypothetical protein HOW73_29560 [Polyangiaceae bacterium]|nr:hypothetical protein [Polyangiaceae bacterium]
MGRTVLVSAGHSESDPGAVGNGYVEARLAVELRDIVARKLRSAGVNVLTDGMDGRNDPLSKAISLARTADVAVEIHWNASNGAGHGIECLAKPNLKPISKALAGAVANATGLVLRGESGWKSDGSGHHKKLGFCEAGGVILEVCFIDNSRDMAAYVANKSAVAQNVADVLAAYASRSAVASGRTGNAAPATKPAADTSGYRHVLLRRGSFNASVGQVQRRLVALGYRVGVDNDFGAETDRAVRGFQRTAGLEVDGVVGSRTWRALFD